MPRRMEGGTLLVAAVLGASAVALGAFGAHALRDALDAAALARWRTAVDYHSWHALALLATALLARGRPSRLLPGAAFAFTIGIVVFSGSLYALVLGAPRGLGALTPVGGLAFIAGWLMVGVHGWRIWRGQGDASR